MCNVQMSHIFSPGRQKYTKLVSWIILDKEFVRVCSKLCGFHTRARSVTNTTIDKSQLIGTFCQNVTF